MEAVFLFGLFILLLMLSVPIGYAIGMVTLVTMLHFTSMPTLMIAQNSIAGVDSFPLLAIPFFMLAGNVMSGGGSFGNRSRSGYYVGGFCSCFHDSFWLDFCRALLPEQAGKLLYVPF